MRGCVVLTAAIFSLSGCSAGLEAFSTGTSAPESAAAPPAFVFDVATDADQATLAERVAAHARRCWVRDDPTYRVDGPFDDDGDAAVTLVFLGDNPAALQEREALRLTIPEASQATYSVAATGPLATADYQLRLLQGLELAAAAVNRCN